MELIKHDYNSRISCVCQKRTCYLMWKNFCIAELTEEQNDAGEIDWVIKVRWEEWEKSGKQNIPGILTELHLCEYIRVGIPYIVSQRTPSEYRYDIRDLLKEVNLRFYDRFEYLCLTRGICGNDDLYIGRTPTDFINYDEWSYCIPKKLNYKEY